MTLDVPAMDVPALAAVAAATEWAEVPDAVRRRVVELTTDVVAVAALGSMRPELRRLNAVTERYAGSGAATLIGSPHATSADAAAFGNGCAVAADQMQDGHRLARGHPASHVVPAVLALAEVEDSSGPELLSAVLAGYEVGVRIGRAMGGTPSGVHDIGTWGQVAAAAGVARLLRPGDADVMRSAIELSAGAVLLTDAATVFAGHTGSHLLLGASVRQGMTAALGAVAGLEPQPGTVERHLRAVAAADWQEIDPGHDGVRWTTHEVLAGYVKDHPTCAHLHGVNDAVQDLVDDGLRAADVVTVDVAGYAGVAEFASVVSTELAARFSVPTSVAVALVTGRLDESTMTDEVVSSAEVQDLANRVTVQHDPALDVDYPDGRPAAVTVTRRDGSTVSASAGRPRWDGDRAPEPGELRAKATRLLERAFGAAALGVLAAFDGLGDGVTPREAGLLLRHAAGAGSDR